MTWTDVNAPEHRRRFRAASLGVAAALILSGCAQMPEAGPPATDIVHDGKGASAYPVVTVTPDVVEKLAHSPDEAFAAFAVGATDTGQVLGVGDKIAITIWESGSLFASSAAAAAASSTTPTVGTTGGQATVLPVQTVGADGSVTIPYAGRLHVAGLTPEAVERAATAALMGKTVLPQVVVTIADNQTNIATVVGDVAHPGRLPLPLGGLRLLDAIALSGGTAAPAPDMIVQVTRDGAARRVRLDEVLRRAADNIPVHPNDVIFLERAPRSVVVLGAATHNAQVLFSKTSMSLAEALGQGGGLVDLQADPYGVFIFRDEGVDAQASGRPQSGAPTIYRIDLKTPQGFFMAQQFQMHDRDLVYVADTQTVQLGKLLHLFSLASSIFSRSSVVSN